jgi:hypothetical protein
VVVMRRKSFTLILGGVALASLTACSPTIRLPRLASPGTAAFQRANAEQFDPYPQNDMGPPIVGGRPREYQVPIPEVNRARQGMPIGPWRMDSRY